MSLLQLQPNTARADDASSHGEDYAKGSSYLLWTTLIAIVVVSVGITAFLLASRKPPVAVGEVTQVWVHPVHTLTTPTDANGVQSATETFDQVLVFSDIRVKNQSDQPIVLKEMLTNITLEDGIHSSYAASATDFNRLFIAYPSLEPMHGKPLPIEATLEPGQTVEGEIITFYRLNKQQWETHKDLDYTIGFRYQPDLKLTPSGPVPER